VRYVIVDGDNRCPGKRVLAAQLVEADGCYDVKEYVRLLVDALCTILSPFGLTRDVLTDYISGQNQNVFI